MIARLVLRLTHRLWNRRIAALLCRAHSRGIIDSEQLHTLAAMFDPTQKHEVYQQGRTDELAECVRLAKKLAGELRDDR